MPHLKITESLKTLTFLTKASLLGSAASYGLTIYLASDLGTEDYGLYSYILAVAGILTIITNYSTDQTAPALIYRGVSVQDVFNKITSLRILLFLATLLSIVIWKRNDFMVLIGVLSINIASLNTSYIYEIQKTNLKYALIFLIERLTYVAVIVLLSFITDLKLLSIVMVYFFVTLTSICFQFWNHRRLLSKFQFISRNQLIQIVRSNLPLVMIAISAFAYGGLSKIIIEDKIGLSALGVFSSGMQLTVVVTIFLSQIERVWRMPLFESIGNRDINMVHKNIKEWLVYSTLPIGIGAFLLFIFGNTLVDLLFGPEYFELKALIPLIGIFFVSISILSLVNNCWIGLDKYKEFLIVSVFFSLILLLILYLLPENVTLRDYMLTILLVQIGSVLFSIIRIKKHLKNLVKNEQ